MRGVRFRVDPQVVLEIDYLRGRLVPTRPGEAPWFDDKTSFTIAIDSARVRLDAGSIATLLNRYVFSYRGTPVRGLQVGIQPAGPDQDPMELRGKLYGIPFRTRSTIEVTPDGELRLRTTSIRVIGIPVTTLMRIVGLSLEKLADWERPRGIRADGNDLLLSPSAIVPPPRVTGRVIAVIPGPGHLTQIFRPRDRGAVPPPLAPADSATPSYMYYRGNTLRFGRLTMVPADLLIQDLTPADPFHFFLDRYREQLARGYSRNTLDGALVTYLPDYRPAGSSKESR